ncbi:class I SAM-dependent methyltransferase [Glycomyces xiaoerkulensis]|uniref:class I SAM-dependent methyltransferase n=1 Tax=Glycomyces xiaoerkulensis TaxID=2038139 RepID=UPI000C269538|nr:class I SAM-dependent methyltransferase [Glycomyces xiaoerkulensis]
MRRSDRKLLAELQSSVEELSAAVKSLGENQRETQERLEAVEDKQRRQRSALQGSIRAAYANVEDMTALYRLIDPERPLPRMRGWAAGPELLRFLYEEITEQKRSRVFECGSGSTTVIVAYALRALGSGRVVALEHLPRFAEQTRRELDERGLSDWAEVVDAKLTDVELDSGTWRWYDPEAIRGDGIDLLLVDGPPAGTGPEARYPALPLLADRLGERAIVVLDDAKRADEQLICEKWIERYPRFRSKLLPHDRGTMVLRPTGSG